MIQFQLIHFNKYYIDDIARLFARGQSPPHRIHRDFYKIITSGLHPYSMLFAFEVWHCLFVFQWQHVLQNTFQYVLGCLAPGLVVFLGGGRM